MIYKALDVIQIFGADGRADGRTNEGVPRGPREPKKSVNHGKTDFAAKHRMFALLTIDEGPSLSTTDGCAFFAGLPNDYNITRTIS